MKRILFFVFLNPIILFAQKTAAPVNGFTITGKIAGLPENTLVYLAGSTEDDTIAKASVKQGNFILKGKAQNIDGRLLVFPSLSRRLFLFVGNDAVKISAKSDFNDVKITGSPSHADYEEFLYEIKPLNDFVNYYRSMMQNAASQASRDSAAIMLNTAYNIYQNSIDRFIARKKSSPAAALLLAFSYDVDANKDVLLVERRLNTLDSAALKNQYARNLREIIKFEKLTAVGANAMDFTQPDTAGKSVSLSQFRGKYVLVDFWASWCKPCRAENPSVVSAYNEFKDKNFTILGVSLDRERERWLYAINIDKLAWSHVSDLKQWDNGAAKLYHVQSIPQNFLLDPNGVIIAKNLRGEELAAKLREVIH